MASMLQNMTRLGVLTHSGRSSTSKQLKPTPATPSSPAQPQIAPPEALFVSSGLKVLTPPGIAPGVREFEQDGIKYRRLDPEYLAWLQDRMHKAQATHRAGKLPTKQWEFLRASFNAIADWAKQAFSRKPIAPPDESEMSDEEAFCSGAPSHPFVRPGPMGWYYPQTGTFAFHQEVTDEALTAVRAIRDEAISLGWSEASLFQNRAHLLYPIGQDWGLVCFLEKGRTLGTISREFIEIVHHEKNGRSSRLHFQNPELMKGQPNKQGENNVPTQTCQRKERPAQGTSRRSAEALHGKSLGAPAQDVLREPPRARPRTVQAGNDHKGDRSQRKPQHKTGQPNSR